MTSPHGVLVLLVVLASAALGHVARVRLVEVGVTDLLASGLAAARVHAHQRVSPQQFTRQIRGPYLRCHPRRLDAAFQNYDDFEVLGEQLFEGEVPERTARVDVVHDADGPGEEDELVVVLRLGPDLHVVLVERDFFAFFCHCLLHEHGVKTCP